MNFVGTQQRYKPKNNEGITTEGTRTKIMDKRVVDIDFGNRNSLVALLMPDGKIETLTSSDGQFK